MLHNLCLNVAVELQPGYQALDPYHGRSEYVINFAYSHITSNKFKKFLTYFFTNFADFRLIPGREHAP